MKHSPSPVSGVALVIVLGFLVIITALAVAFFTSVTTELKASRNFAGGVTTRQLADSAVQIVMGQIADATTRGLTSGGLGTEAWASQPGMIRVFNQAGAPDAYYLLYSYDDMVKTGSTLTGSNGFWDPAQDLYTNGKQWDTLPAVWTDLNAPVMSWDYVASPGSTAANPNYSWQEVPRFPIVDPRAFSDPSLSTSTPAPSGAYNSAWANNKVEGFWYDAPDNQVDGIVGPGGSSPNSQRLPMPVKWIYVLKDGTLTTPTSWTAGSGTSGPTATFSYTGAQANMVPSQTNPIVGRMAFWTDDETCKLNLNTAAGFINNPNDLPNGYTDPTTYAGSFWDTPRYYTQFDYGNPYYPGQGGPAGTPKPGGGGLALCQLLQNEFQRYPGHPATTSLAPVFNNLLNQLGVQMVSNQLYGLLPRYSTYDMTGQPGTTNGGTQRIIVDDSQAGARGAQTQGTDGEPNSIDNRAIQPKQDRLYASVDELLFGAHAGGPNVGTPNQQNPNYRRIVNDFYTNPPLNTSVNGNQMYTPEVLTPPTIDSLRFFLTTQSRAPDVNLWGQPRVTTWPVRAETATETPSGMNVFDNLILFCSTIGANANPSSSGRPDTSDQQAVGADSLTNGQFRYMFTRREIDKTLVTGQGVPPTLQAASGFQSYYDCEFPRNKYLLGTYLYNFLSGKNGAIPGFGTNWNVKYSTGDVQSLLMEIFDYIRCANSQDTTTSLSSGQPIKFAPQGAIMPSVPQSYPSPWHNGLGGVKGAGRLSSIYEATMVFYYAGPVMNPTTGNITVDTLTVSNNGWSKWDPHAQASRYVYQQPAFQIPQSAPAKYWSQNYMRAFLLFSTFDPMQGYAPKADPVNAGVNNINSPLSSIPASPQLTIQSYWTSDPTIQFYIKGALNATKYPMYWYNGPAGKAINPSMPTIGSNTGPYTSVNRAPGSYWGGRNFGGYEGFMHTLMGPGSSITNGKSTYPGLEKVAWSPTNLTGPPSPLLAYGNTVDYGTSLYPATSGAATWATGTGLTITNQFAAPPVTGAPTTQEFYPFQTMNIPQPATSTANCAIAVPANATGFALNPCTLTVTLYYGGVSAANQMQQFTLSFPGTTTAGGWPIPQGGVGCQLSGNNTYMQPLQKNTIVAGSSDVTTWGATVDAANVSALPTSATVPPGMSWWYWRGTGAFFQNTVPVLNNQTNYHYRTSLQASWSFNTRLAWCVGSGMFNNAFSNGTSTNSGGDANGINSNPSTTNTGVPIEYDGNRLESIVQPGDTIRSLLYWDGNSANLGGEGSPLSNISPIASGDLRVAQLSATVQATNFAMHPDYQSPWSRACCLRRGDGGLYFPVGQSPAPVLAVSGNMNKEGSLGNQIWLGNGSQQVNSAGAFGNLPWGGGTSPKGVNGVLRNPGFKPGDWDNGAGAFPDGPFLNKQDEGNVIYRYLDIYTGQYVYPIPYFTFTQSYQVPGNSFTSPARQMPSPAMMGSLPAHIIGSGGFSAPSPHQWETLCFSPNPAGSAHPGLTDPKDHLLLDLFSMPIVEPYPISEPFSTAGRVNLNYRIAPFDYIRRSTALRGALYSVRVSLAPSQYSNGGGTPNYLYYKTGLPNNGSIPTGPDLPTTIPITSNFRKLVDRDQTIMEMDAVFNTPPNALGTSKGCFMSASQICEMFLIPWNSGAPLMSNGNGASITSATSPGSNISAMQNFWLGPEETGNANGDLTGDNEREKPYVDLYPRITTKSNTYTVHVKVQTLRQLPHVKATDYATWNEGKDAVIGEYRGSYTIERYVQPDDPRIGTGTNPDGTAQTNPDSQSVEPLYRFRTVITKKFSP